MKTGRHRFAAILLALALVLVPLSARADDGGPGAEQADVSWALGGWSWLWTGLLEHLLGQPAEKCGASIDPMGGCQPASQAVPPPGGDCGSSIDPWGACQPPQTDTTACIDPNGGRCTS